MTSNTNPAPTAVAEAMVELLDDVSDRAMARVANACVDMIAGMVEARLELGMDDDEIADSIRESLIRMMRNAK